MCAPVPSKLLIPFQLTTSPNLLSTEIRHIPIHRSYSPSFVGCPAMAAQLEDNFHVAFMYCSPNCTVTSSLCPRNAPNNRCLREAVQLTFVGLLQDTLRSQWYLKQWRGFWQLLHFELVSTSCGTTIKAGHNILCSIDALQP